MIIIPLIHDLLVRDFHAGLLDGLLGVAGIIMKIIMDWIMKPHSLRETHLIP